MRLGVHAVSVLTPVLHTRLPFHGGDSLLRARCHQCPRVCGTHNISCPLAACSRLPHTQRCMFHAILREPWEECLQRRKSHVIETFAAPASCEGFETKYSWDALDSADSETFTDQNELRLRVLTKLNTFVPNDIFFCLQRWAATQLRGPTATPNFGASVRGTGHRRLLPCLRETPFSVGSFERSGVIEVQQTSAVL